MGHHRAIITIAVLAGFSVFMGPVVRDSYAQPPPGAASQATRESDKFGREMEKRAEREMRKAPTTSAKPKPEMEKLKPGEQPFFVKRIKLAGCESYSSEDFEFLAEKYENRDETLTELNNLTREIAAEYLKRGIIAAVFIPPQEVQDEVVTLQVVEAKMGVLDLKKPPFFTQKMMRSYWSIREGEILRYDKMSKSLQLMNKNPDREVKAALHAGDKPGTTNVILTSKTRFPIHGHYTFDREGILTTGKQRDGFVIKNNNMLGLDDTLIASISYGADFKGEYIYHSLPISGQGASIMYGYSYSLSTPQKDFDVYALKSEAENTTFSIRQDIYKKDNYIGEVSVGFDAKDKTTWYKLGQGTLNRDRLRPINITGSFIIRSKDSVTSINPELDQGINWLGASQRNNPLASRAGATPDYTKFLLSVQNRTNLPFDLQQSLRFRTQLASQKLFSQEQYGLGGLDTVRGYPPSDYLADKMMLFNVEYLSPLFFLPKDFKLPYAPHPLKDEITGVVFLDYGYGELCGYPKPRKLASFGAGVRMSMYNQVFLRLEWGIPFKFLGGQPALTEGSTKGRFHISLNIEDRLPEEVGRIMTEMREERKQKEAAAIINEEFSRPGSPIRHKILSYLSRADELRRQGRFKESRKLYAMVVNIGKSLNNQAQEYIKGCDSHYDALNKKNDEALALFREGKMREAKRLWQEIKGESKPRPLELEY